jgi:hypothetical protein
MNRYYVYFHRLLDDNTIFYVGKGTGDRLKKKGGRGKRWKSITSNKEWYYELYKDNLSESEALDLESSLIRKLQPDGNMRLSGNRYNQLDQKFILENYEYNPNSPTGLSYKPKNGKPKIGKYGGAGFLSGNYYKIKGALNGSNVPVHRVVWFLVKGFDPETYIVDHLDGDTLNNRIENLRLATVKENNRNLGLRYTNTTGFHGVVEKENYYLSSWKDNGKCRCKVFSKRKYGEKLALDLAVYNRVIALKDLGYSERHLPYFSVSELLKLDKTAVDNMLLDSTRDDNTSGFTGVHLLDVNGYKYWAYKQGSEIKNRFSILKYGDSLAKALAIESRNKHLNNQVNTINEYSAVDVENMLNDSNYLNSSNNEHIYQNGNMLQLLIKNKHGFLSKKRSVSKHGYDKAMAELVKIRDEFLMQV